ncbi:class IV adenylate cyclase [Pontibacter sp. G13]|uniref:class IV adenylate cyclase n=1 Tax=Pontibacter sp. G13 TaxID=3074898 RepID=UPI00288B036C|nr:class IV adenylate cyclase [Pontibacter sp. G13]WNJ16213.1 class IV adenylate cyclase [Pontibacter sp. G13]
MKEIEVKILEIDQEALKNRLSELGARQSFHGELHAVFLDDPQKSLTQQGQLLRVRKEGDSTKLTFKKPISKSGAKIMEELEVGISDIDLAVEIFERLGFQSFKSTRKFRTQFDYLNSHIVIDDYQDDLGPIPPFIEVESPNMEELQQVVSDLGYQQEQCKSWNTYDLVQYYGIQ